MTAWDSFISVAVNKKDLIAYEDLILSTEANILNFTTIYS